jgi:hypothetical protein
VELEVVDKTPLVDWLANHYKDFGAKLEFVTNKSQEGSQFVRGFGGIGGILRWKLDFLAIADAEAVEGIKTTRAAAAAAAAASSGGAGGGLEEGADYDDDDDDEGGGRKEYEGEGDFGDLIGGSGRPTQTTFEEEVDFM